jgi:hypothetical protein
MAIMDRVRRGEHDLNGLPADLRQVVRAALDPDPRRRPTLQQIRDRVVGGPVPVIAEPVSPVEPEDPYTVPLALAAASHDRTISLFDEDEPEEPGSTRLLDEDIPAPRAPLAERARRGLLLLGLGLAAATGIAAYPWMTLGVLAVLTWLFRSASLAASAAGARRSLRGARWYDGLQLLIASPWHAVQALPGAVLLLLWSLGLGLACGLICYALAATEPVTLFASGLVTAGAIWFGPGGSRFRGPVTRMVNPLCRALVSWLISWIVVVGAALGLAVLATDRGTDWAPIGDPLP